jgi:Plasmid pRiA4b ORF-3-like protein
MARKAATPGRIYQLKITLDGSKPPIWRRVEVADTVTLAKLHMIIQAAMGWTDSHLHMFTVGGTTYGVPDPDDEMEIRDERRIALNRLLSAPKQKLIYEYDFGDSWTHQVLLEQVGEPEAGAAYPYASS